MEISHKTYLPAAGLHWLLPLYDPMSRLMGADHLRALLLDQAELRPGHRVLDIGCGTGSFAVQIARVHPDVTVVGLDPDEQALARARAKATRIAAHVRFDQGFADALPYPEGAFDRVFSSFMYHHLEADQKQRALREIRRVLTPGGSFHLLDFAGPDGHPTGLLARLVQSRPRLRDNARDRILEAMTKAGFTEVRETARRLRNILPLQVAYYRAAAPAPRPRAL